MQPVNDDMDNLFRRAADSYPLNSDGANFDAIRQQLDAENELPEKKKKERKYLWFLLLLLLPLLFLFQKYYTIHIGLKNQQKEEPVASAKENSKTLDNKENVLTKNTLNQKSTDNDQSKNVTTLDRKNKQSVTTTPGTTYYTIQPGERKELSRNNSSKQYTSSNTDEVAIRTDKKDRQSRIAIIKRRIPLEPATEAILPSYTYKRKQEKKETGNLPLQDKEIEKPMPVSAVKGNTTMNYTTKPTDSVRKSEAIKTTLDSSTNAINKAPFDSLNVTASKKTIIKKKNDSKSGLYIGIVGGTDASTVKSNKASSAGYNVGLVAGYQSGKHLSFETGIIWNHKKYYSDGRNVTTDKLDLYTHSQIVYMNGTCSMIEIPVSVQYHFNIKGNHNWYVGTGLSSYIMKKENYDYLYNRYNMQYYGQKEYTNTTTNWLSVLQFNIGYQVKLSKAIHLRIEPYAKLPLKGLGIAKLPISSIGANVGFTLPIH